MKKGDLACTTSVLVVSFATCIQKCHACSSESKDEAQCWYTLWYIWFVLGLFIIVIAVLIVLYIKHRTKERSRARRRRRSTRTVPIHIVPTGPPGYMEPGHKPPSYEEATRSRDQSHSVVCQQQQQQQPQQTVVPGIIHTCMEEYSYQPPPTSMRVSTPISNIYQPQPPPYSATVPGQSQGHPT